MLPVEGRLGALADDRGGLRGFGGDVRSIESLIRGSAAAIWLLTTFVLLPGCPGPSADDLAFKRDLEQRSGRSMVCQTSAHSGYCCQFNVDGSYVPGRQTYCNHR